MAELELKMSNANIDPNLLGWLQAAARMSPYRVVAYSGKREGDPRFHGKGQAVDVNLFDPKTGARIPNYQSAEGFAAYQGFANQVRAMQMQANPELAKALRWGGYFSGGKGKYGALDLMHFDTGGESVPMGGGSWETGLTPEQAAIWGLSAGGGVSGGASPAPGTAPLADVFSPALPEAETPLQSMASAFAKGVKKPGEIPETTSSLVGDEIQETQSPDLETQSAVPFPSDLDTPGGSLESSPLGAGGLADLFDVKDIGSPLPQIGKPRFASPRRGF